MEKVQNAEHKDDVGDITFYQADLIAGTGYAALTPALLSSSSGDVFIDRDAAVSVGEAGNSHCQQCENEGDLGHEIVLPVYA